MICETKDLPNGGPGSGALGGVIFQVRVSRCTTLNPKSKTLNMMVL
jgi:hypothetical protein